MSRAQQQSWEAIFLQLYKTELVVRLESERREAKARLRLMDAMTSTLDDQLLYVAQFKKQWLQHRMELEAERRAVMEAEEGRRVIIAAECAEELMNIIRRRHPSTRQLQDDEL